MAHIITTAVPEISRRVGRKSVQWKTNCESQFAKSSLDRGWIYSLARGYIAHGPGPRQFFCLGATQNKRYHAMLPQASLPLLRPHRNWEN